MSEVSRRDSVSYESKKDRPELKSSVMAKKSERKLYPEPQVERKVSEEAVELVVVGPRTGGAAVEENENSGSGSSKENKAPLKKSGKAEKPQGDVSPHIPLSAMAGYDFPFLNHFLGGGKKKEDIPEPPKSKPPSLPGSADTKAEKKSSKPSKLSTDIKVEAPKDQENTVTVTVAKKDT